MELGTLPIVNVTGCLGVYESLEGEISVTVIERHFINNEGTIWYHLRHNERGKFHGKVWIL